jgi:hypothetical protein
MKIRLTQRGGIFTPQYYKSGGYSSGWIGFGKPNVRFTDRTLALQFVNLVDKAEPFSPNKLSPKIIWKNFADEEKQ